MQTCVLYDVTITRVLHIRKTRASVTRQGHTIQYGHKVPNRASLPWAKVLVRAKRVSGTDVPEPVEDMMVTGTFEILECPVIVGASRLERREAPSVQQPFARAFSVTDAVLPPGYHHFVYRTSPLPGLFTIQSMEVEFTGHGMAQLVQMCYVPRHEITMNALHHALWTGNDMPAGNSVDGRAIVDWVCHVAGVPPTFPRDPSAKAWQSRLVPKGLATESASTALARAVVARALVQNQDFFTYVHYGTLALIRLSISCVDDAKERTDAFRRTLSLHGEELAEIRERLVNEPELQCFENTALHSEWLPLANEESLAKVHKAMGTEPLSPLVSSALRLYRQRIYHATRADGHSWVTIPSKDDAKLAWLVAKKAVVVVPPRVYLTRMYEAEMTIVRSFEAMFREWHKNRCPAAWPRTNRNGTLDEDQHECVEAVRTGWPVMVITGPGGTGKTTVMAHVVSKLPKETVFATAIASRVCWNTEQTLRVPTSNAARLLCHGPQCLAPAPKLSETRQTKHGPIKKRYREDEKEETTRSFQKIKTLIIEEASTLGTETFANVLTLFHRSGVQLKQIIFVGDERQLPSIAAGSLLECVIQGLGRRSPLVHELRNNHRTSAVVLHANATALGDVIQNRPQPTVVFQQDPDSFVISPSDTRSCTNWEERLSAQTIRYLTERNIREEDLQCLAFTNVERRVLNAALRTHWRHISPKAPLALGDIIVVRNNRFVCHTLELQRKHPIFGNLQAFETIRNGIVRITFGTHMANGDTYQIARFFDHGPEANTFAETIYDMTTPKKTTAAYLRYAILLSPKTYAAWTASEQEAWTCNLDEFAKATGDSLGFVIVCMDHADDREALDTGYANTVHSMQGTGAKEVVYGIGYGSKYHSQKVLYTAITRGIDRVAIIDATQKSALKEISQTRTHARTCSLCQNMSTALLPISSEIKQVLPPERAQKRQKK